MVLYCNRGGAEYTLEEVEHLIHQAVRKPETKSYLETALPGGPLAQLVEHLTFNQGVTGSRPVRPTIHNKRYNSHDIPIRLSGWHR